MVSNTASNAPAAINYSQYLAHQGHGLAEAEVTSVLKVVLTQLSKAHTKGKAHGSLCPSHLLKLGGEQPVGLLASKGLTPELMAYGYSGATSTPSQDTYALGVTALVLLTGKSPEQLRQPDGSWQWQNDCLVSDQLESVLQQATHADPSQRYGTAGAMLEALEATPVPLSFELNPSKPQGKSKAGLGLSIGGGAIATAALVWFFALRLQPQPIVVQPSGATAVTGSNSANPSGSAPAQSFSTLSQTELEASAESLDQPRDETAVLVRSPAEKAAIASEVGADYQPLQSLLQQQSFWAADQETTRIMLNIAGREVQNSLNAASLRVFPCTDLKTIDQLWRRHSQNRFGFTIQNQIWQSTNRDANRFALSIGWMHFGKMKDYSALNFSPDAVQGHLPVGDYGPLYLVGIKKFNPALEQRLSVCGIR